MNGFITRQWRETYAYMQRLRPNIERRARTAPGSNYTTNLAREWRLMLIRTILT